MIISLLADHRAQTEWALGIKTAIANYLQEGPDGRHYYRMVDTVLSRDKNWVRWKMENCQPFTRDRVQPQDFLQAKSGVQRAVLSKKPPKPMGVPPTLDFLYNAEAEKGLSKLRQRDRYVFRSSDRRPKTGSHCSQIQCTERRVICKESPND
jgi:THO complex subunit 1